MSQTSQNENRNEAVEAGHGGAPSPGAFAEMVRPFYPKIYRWALVLTGNHDEAEDVTQDAVIRAYRHFDSYRGEASISTWLYRITRNVAVEMMSRKKKRREREAGHLAREALERASVMEQSGTVDSGQLLDIVRAFFSELSRRQREVFDLVDLQGFEPSEAARMLEIDAATARTHLFRARRTIRRRILEHYPELLEVAGG